jgi:hypothetical protein
MAFDTVPAGTPGTTPLPPHELLQALDGWLAGTGHDSAHPWRASIAHTLAAHPHGASAPRVDLALQCAWELQGLAEALGSMFERELRRNGATLALRGMILRIDTLACATMSALDLDEDLESAREKFRGRPALWDAA